ncbi:lysozyme inhibitor LprI family protein [Paraburkholderia humisilvae]|uniref:Lysozyme inhibitor LprI-like N-terminal domain-containing protein n=1 Tax=Paraburkholderia humisilvae TaxID=627669 RepID=A0A6J5DGE6_9BURK|nr:lysozyme inhibitor LprI family protein [Paraburkholderia humisilvae]CAB3752524.1 hypothetical protein LMG29542_01792 [Paraburkholderia humisilvae]
MIRHTNILLPLLLVPVLAVAQSRYSGDFDFQDFQSSKMYFSNFTAAQVEHLCMTGEHASNEDLEQCEHRKFERADLKLNTQLRAMKSLVDNSDKFVKEYGEKPLSAPYFLKAQRSWIEYRNNECYTETYMMGQAVERYIRFWNCMATMTNNRINEIKQYIKDWGGS